jgi:hypothetical protein
VEHQSFRLDCYILWRSLASVASGRGVSADGEATVQAFRGEQLPASATKGTTGRQDTDGVPHG